MLRFLIAFCFFSFQLFQVILTLNPFGTEAQKQQYTTTTTVITARFKRCITASSDNRTLLDLSGQ